MEKRIYLTAVISAILFGVVLLALGILIGRFWTQPQSPTRSTLEISTGSASVMRPGNTVVVQGHSLVWIEPEIAQLSMGVEACGQDAGSVNQTVNANLDSVVERLKMAGVVEDGIVPSEFSLYPRYEQQTLIGFCAENKLLVTTGDLEDVSSLLDQAIEAGVTNVYSVRFTVKDTDVAKQEAIRLAFADADQQMKQLSKVLGQKIGEIVEIEVNVEDNLSAYVAGYRGGGGMIAPQEGTLEATITLVFELPRK